ncbi:MutS protein 5 like [Verticillium longisporum]|nr:MutS protein 5 like [Verticillium longisporum]
MLKSHHGTPNWQMPNHSHPQILPINSVLAMSQSANMKKHSFGGLLCASTISINLSHMPIHFEGSRSERSFRARPHAQQTVLPSTPPDGSDDAFSSPSRLFEQGQAHALGTTPENIQNNESGDFYETVNAEEVVLAVSFVERGSLGCAYFATNTQELRILHDMQYADVDVLEALLAHVQPTVVLLPFKTPEVVVSLFERHANIWDEGSGQCSYAIRMLTSANFSHSNAVKRLANLKLSSMSAPRAVVRPGLAGGTTESFESTSELRLHSAIIGVTRLSSFIDLDSLSSVACAGAILGELSRYDGHADDPGHIRCRDLQMFALKDYLLISNDTMHGVQLRKGVDSTSGRGSFNRGVWWTLRRFVVGALQLREAIRGLSPVGEIILAETIVRIISPNTMKELGETVGSTIDFRESRPNSRVTVRWGVNDELDRLKRDYNGMEDLLSQVVSDLSNELPEWARNIVTSCIFWPQLGFLTMVPLCPDSEEPMYDGQGLDCDNWQIMFSAERKAYYKNHRMRELDAHLGDMYGGILDLEVEILHNLAVDVMVHEDALLAAADICGELDALVAMALAAGKYGWTAPKVTMSNVLTLSGVDSSVVDRAKTIAHILSSNEDLNAAYTTLDAEDYNRLRDAEDVARRFLNVAPRNLAIGVVGDVGNIRNTLRSVLYEDTGSNCHL